MAVEFLDFSIQVKEAMNDKALQFLEEAASAIESAARRNSRVDTGQLKGSWNHQVDESAKEAQIGSPEQNAVWEEFGTGEYALHGDGRKGGWTYQDDSGDWHHTNGKTPNRTLHNAFESKKAAIIRRAKQIFKGLGS
mgnify:CR=1 FL=1